MTGLDYSLNFEDKVEEGVDDYTQISEFEKQAGSIGVMESKFSIIGTEFEIHIFEMVRKHMDVLRCILKKILSRRIIL